MHRGREARLDRLTRRTGEEDRAAVERHHVLRARAAIGAAVRWSLAGQGSDPACAPALLIADEAAAELAASGQAPLQSCDEWPAGACALPPRSGDDPEPPDGSEVCFDSRIERLVGRYRQGPQTEPDFALASLAELLAWCLARGDGAAST